MDAPFGRLPDDDPLARLVVSAFGDLDEAVWTGVEAIDWRQRMTPGTPLAYAERLLVATSRRLLILYRDADAHDEAPGLPASEVPYVRMRNVEVAREGTSGRLSMEYRTDEGAWIGLTYLIADHARAEQLASTIAANAGG